MAKILFIQPAFAHYRRELFDLIHSNHAVTFIFLKGQEASEYQYPGGKVINSHWTYVTLHAEKHRLWPLHLLWLLLRSKPDVIVTSINGSAQTIVSILSRCLRKTPVVLWSESWGAPYRSLEAPLWKNVLRNWRTRWTTTQADALVVGGSRSWIFHKALGITDNRMFKSFQSTDDQSVLGKTSTCANLVHSATNSINILYFSRIVESKGLDILLRAYSLIEQRCSKTNLIVAGDGPFRFYCEQLADQLELSNVCFHGPIPNEKAWQHFQQADIFVLPCSGKGRGEGWGLVINEATSMGLPIVTTDAVGAVGDLAVEGVNGYVVEPGNADALANALEKLINDHDLRNRMGRESRRLFETVNSYEQMYAGFDAAIRCAQNQAKQNE